MLQALRKNTLTFFKTALVAGFIFVSVFGLWQTFGMPMDNSGNMVGCPLMGESSALCQMTFTEHIQAWQAMFTVIPQKVFGSILTLLLLAAAIIFTFVIHRRWRLLSLRLFELSKLYIKEHPHLSFFNPIKEAFSQGILNPRIYA